MEAPHLQKPKPRPPLRLDRSTGPLHDQSVGEYATVTAALSLLASSLTGTLGSALPSSNAKAAAAVATIARSHHVSGARARAAYEHAPYRTPALRYLYSIGWVSAASDLNACKAAQVIGPNPVTAATQALRGPQKTLALLRSAHVTVGAAAAAIGRGTTDGCS